MKNSDSLQDDGVVVEIVDVIVEIVDVIVESESNSYEDIEKNIAELQHLLKDENFQSEKSQQAIIRSIEFLNSQQKQSL